jgi:hypothetical protein
MEFGSFLLISPKQIAAVNLVSYILQVVDAVGHDDIRFSFELYKVVEDARVEEPRLFEHRFVNNHVNTFGLDAFHDALMLLAR